MAGNSNSAPTVLWRVATKFRALVIGPRANKSDSPDQGARLDMVRLSVQGAPGQTGDLVQFLKSDGTVLGSIDSAGQLGTLKVATVTVTAAELLALYTTAKALVAAPGAGKVIEFIRATVSYVYGTGAYTIGASTNLSVKYKDKTGADVTSTRATTGFIDQTSSQYSMFQPLTAQLALDANAVNQPLCLALAGGNPTGGDGTLKVNIVYRIHSL